MVTFKIIHTADWHLGHRYADQDRSEEQQYALNWLLEKIEKERADLLFVAGDIFDTANPSNAVRQLYYDFLIKLTQGSCRHLVIIGGNHDSPGMLDAPKGLLRRLGIHVLGAANGDINEQIIELKDKSGQLEAVVAAVPFLRSQDIRYSVAGESGMQRIERIQAGIRAHYAAVGIALEKYADQGIPIIGSGHLHASGAEASEGQTDIYLSNHENISATDFPVCMDYVALGHLHKAQSLGDHYHIRYSGSLLPMNFSDAQNPKSVSCVTFDGRKMTEGIRTLEIPEFRKLITAEGNVEQVCEQLKSAAEASKDAKFQTWAEAMVHLDKLFPNLYAYLQEFVKDKPVLLLKIQEIKSFQALDEQTEEETKLEDLTVLEVFHKKCSSAGLPPNDTQELESTFLELQEWIRDKE